MKEIFKKLEGIEWDIFNTDKFKYTIGTFDYSLADLLASKSWCKAVWGKGGTKHYVFWEFYSSQAFQTLQQEGEEACIKYIKKTMI